MTDRRDPAGDDAEFDYIIVGAGSAGCVLADRLSADGKHRVLLIEAGADDRLFGRGGSLRNSLIHIPVGFAATIHDPRFTWGYRSEPEADAAGRVFDVPRGRVIGGSSSINAMLHVRGMRSDYDGWRDGGCPGWGWDDVLPYFRRAETQQGDDDAWVGREGPLRISQAAVYPVVEKVLEAAADLGLPRATSFNDGTQFGGGPARVAIHGGRRQSASVAYLDPARRRRNLTVVTRAHVLRIRFDGKRTRGVEYVLADRRIEATARREVLLCAGAIGSPHLLQLSGIGDAETLAALGIPVVADAPSVGAHLQDHYFARIVWQLRDGVKSINRLARFPAILGEAAKYLVSRKGVLTSSASQIFLYAKSDPDQTDADIQYSIAPASVQPAVAPGERIRPDATPGLTFASCQLRPLSRGEVRIASTDPHQQPMIRFNYLAAEEDRRIHVAGVRLARRIAGHPALAALIAQETAPGAAADSDDAILADARAHGGSVYHPVGTVRMGADALSPLDPELRVRGVEGLRVVDASIMPALVSGNTNSPTIMIAEKAADVILRAARA